MRFSLKKSANLDGRWISTFKSNPSNPVHLLASYYCDQATCLSDSNIDFLAEVDRSSDT